MSTAQYAKVQYQGHTLDNYTLAGFLLAQGMGPDDDDWTIIKGSYVEGDCDTGSSCTHGGGGALDISAFNHEQRERQLRACAFAAWYRPPNWDGQGGDEHIHCEQIGNVKATPQAKAQWAQYINYTNGLASAAPDNTWHPFPKGGPPLVLRYGKYTDEVKRVAGLQAALKATGVDVEKAIRNAQSDIQADMLREISRSVGKMNAVFRYRPNLYVVERGSKR